MDIKDTTSKVSEGLDRAQERVTDLGQTAGAAFDGARHKTAAALDDTASSVRSSAETIETLSEGTAGKLSSAAEYVHSHDFSGMLLSMRQVIGRHPVGFAFLAASLGFLVGSTVQRSKPRD
jgi:ElaB/YqjD/DUF883 family membrane-anchored ribosome-binding protein